MPSKKRKYNARFPAGRIKKIMQTDEEVGKVAQAVPIIILELFVESLLGKALQVTLSRSAKTLSPSHVKHCILAEARFDFLRDLVKNIPDVSAAEDKEPMSDDNSPCSLRIQDSATHPPLVTREDSNSSNSSDAKPLRAPMPPIVANSSKRSLSIDSNLKTPITETVTSCVLSSTDVMDLTVKQDRKPPPLNFYQETLPQDIEHKSVITPNPIYSVNTPQPSTSFHSSEPAHKIDTPLPKHDSKPFFSIDVTHNNNIGTTQSSKKTATPIFNIDFSKIFTKPEIKILDATKIDSETPKIQMRNSKHDFKNITQEPLTPTHAQVTHIDLSTGNLQIDEDYDT